MIIDIGDNEFAAKRILLADDDRLVLATIAQGLRDAGFQVITASSGEEALELAKENSFELALLDIRMPGMSGIETAQHLKDTHGLPVMFLSAYNDSDLVRDAIDKGGMAYAVKPIDIAQLIPLVQTTLARARDLRELKESRSHLEKAMISGRETSMAIGIVMERQGVGKDAAFEILRANARNRQRKMSDYCRDLVSAEEQLNALTAKTAV